MKKIIILILFFVVAAILFIAMLKPTPLVAETPTDSELLKKTQQASDLLFNKIGYCESKNDPLADNPYSSAKGRFQFLDGTWNYYAPMLWGDAWVEKDVFDYQHNTDLAWFVYTNYGTSDWEADPKSFNCWKSEVSNAIYKNIY